MEDWKAASVSDIRISGRPRSFGVEPTLPHFPSTPVNTASVNCGRRQLTCPMAGAAGGCSTIGMTDSVIVRGGSNRCCGPPASL